MNSSNPVLATATSLLKKDYNQKKKHQRTSNASLKIQAFAEQVIESSSLTSPRVSPASKPATRAQVAAATKTVLVQKNVKKENIKRDSQKKISVQRVAQASATVAKTHHKSFFGRSKRQKDKEVDPALEATNNFEYSLEQNKRKKTVLNLKDWNHFPVSAALFNQICATEGALLVSYIKLIHDMEILPKDHKDLVLKKNQYKFCRDLLDKVFAKKSNRWLEAAKQAQGTIPRCVNRTRISYEETMIAMARLLLLNNPPKRITGGSGGIYQISNDGKPVFVFKPTDEIMGAPGCPNKNEDLMMEEDRIIDDDRVAFPLSEDSLREYALGILFPEGPRKVLACLKLSGAQDEKSLGASEHFNTKDYKTGVLIEYIDHLFTIDDLQNYVQAGYRKRELNDAEESGDENKELSSEQQKVVDECVSSIEPGQIGPITKAQLLVWDRITSQSLDRMLLELLSVPNFDPNGKNLLLKNSNRPNEYELVGIDAGQVLPDTWQSINMPPWINAKRFDSPLNQSGYLCERIQLLNAVRMLETLRKEGVVFQENPQDVNHPVRGAIKVGGDLYNILNAFHTVAKVGCVNGNTINEIFHVLYEQDKLHHLFTKACHLANPEQKKEKQKMFSNKQYQNFIMEKEYKLFFNPDCYQEKTKQFWNLFEAVILEQLNKSKSKGH